MSQSDRWAAAATAVRHRMSTLRLRQADLVRLTGLSDPTIRGIMRGDPRGEPDERTLALVCDALNWRDDGFERLFAGLEPVEVAPVKRTATTEQRLASLEQRVAVLVRIVLVGQEESEADAVTESSLLAEHVALLRQLADVQAHPPTE